MDIERNYMSIWNFCCNKGEKYLFSYKIDIVYVKIAKIASNFNGKILILDWARFLFSHVIATKIYSEVILSILLSL